VTEALSPEHEFYSVERLQAKLGELAPLPVEKITRGVMRDVQGFSAEREQADDISVLALRWLGAPTAS
jgi:serine phosphatase RsbU (regulator of sigma subunit)